MEKDCDVKQRPRSVKEFFRSSFFWKPFISLMVGGLAGFLYFYFVGCKSGACAITSNSLSSIVMGSVLGFFITSSPCTRCNPS